ncbi:MAG: hypothetical protein HZB16_09265 [Armatimonadetes bacterium]|nr:hypothetical protein [Armatimonadota bacterium]
MTFDPPVTAQPPATAQPPVTAQPFYRRVILGTVGNRQVPFWLILAAVAVLLFIQVIWPRLRAETRGITVAYALFLLLTPVLNYGPQTERLKLLPADAVVLTNQPTAVVTTAADFNSFQPRLPVTAPLCLALLLTGAWCIIVPRRAWPTSFRAAAFCLVLFVLGDLWLIHMHLVARGQANHLDYTYWPGAMASLWVLGQLLVGMAATLAACRDELRARIMGFAMVLLLFSAALLSRGGR